MLLLNILIMSLINKLFMDSHLTYGWTMKDPHTLFPKALW